ncbi:MAG: hypothetical protein NVS3B24_22700 [Candidatus Dormibacteria bacterium]
MEPTAVNVMAATSQHTPWVAALLSGELGEGMYTDARVASEMASNSTRVTVATAASLMVGAAISRLLAREDGDYYREFGPAAVALFERPPVGSFEAVAVSAEARRRGAGAALLEDAVEWFRLSGCSAAVGIAWISGRQASSASVFRRAGFTAGRTLPEFFLESSRAEQWTCPVCGGPCHCPAQFVSRVLSAPPRADLLNQD